MGKSKFEITKRTNGNFMFNLKAGNGEIILTSEGYQSKQGCKAGIASVKENAPDEDNYEKKIAKDDRFYFNLKASNGEIIGTSQMYITSSSRNNGIKSVQDNAPDADVNDLT